MSLTLTGLVIGLLTAYLGSDQGTHLGAFYGNAVADWLGVLAFVIATKYFFEIGSGESRSPAPHFHQRVGRFLLKHSLTLVLGVTALAWVIAFVRADVDSKPGELFGNIVSDWLQVLGLVILTKYTRERDSKEGQ